MSESRTQSDTPSMNMAPTFQSLIFIGWLGVALGLAAWGWAAFQGVGIVVPELDGDSVVNLSLLHKRELGFQVGTALLVAGSVFAGSGHIRKALEDLLAAQKNQH